MSTSTPPATFAVLFSDIVGSSKLFQQWGNDAAKKKIGEMISEMIVCVDRTNGTLVKTIGDEVMVYFESPEQACEAAIAINIAGQSSGFSVRTGIAYGPVIFDAKDVYGHTVNAAASLTRAAHASEILVDQPSVENLPTWLASHCELFDRVKLKGRADKSNVYRVNWRSENSQAIDVTQVDNNMLPMSDSNTAKLQIRTGDKTIILSAEDGPLSIGRDAKMVSLAIEDARISRNHCSISYNRGKFILEDHSTNGCYLQEAGHEIVYLRRESAPLVRVGQINLGYKQSNRYNSISYRLLQ